MRFAKSVNCANSSIDVADDVVLTASVVAADVVPTRTVGTRALTVPVLLTPTRLLTYNGVLTVSVCTNAARAVLPVLADCDDERVVNPGVELTAVVARVERIVVDGRLETVLTDVSRAVRVVASRAAVARTVADVVAARDDVVDVVGAAVVVVRAVTVRAGVTVVPEFRDETARDAADDATARDVDARPVAVRGLTIVVAAGATGV